MRSNAASGVEAEGMPAGSRRAAVKGRPLGFDYDCKPGFAVIPTRFPGKVDRKSRVF